jgi:hypothetical protein
MGYGVSPMGTGPHGRHTGDTPYTSQYLDRVPERDGALSGADSRYPMRRATCSGGVPPAVEPWP